MSNDHGYQHGGPSGYVQLAGQPLDSDGTAVSHPTCGADSTETKEATIDIPPIISAFDLSVRQQSWLEYCTTCLSGISLRTVGKATWETLKAAPQAAAASMLLAQTPTTAYGTWKAIFNRPDFPDTPGGHAQESKHTKDLNDSMQNVKTVSLIVSAGVLFLGLAGRNLYRMMYPESRDQDGVLQQFKRKIAQGIDKVGRQELFVAYVALGGLASYLANNASGTGLTTNTAAITALYALIYGIPPVVADLKNSVVNEVRSFMTQGLQVQIRQQVEQAMREQQGTAAVSRGVAALDLASSSNQWSRIKEQKGDKQR